MVSRGAGSVTHCPLLWMADLGGAACVGGGLPKASAGTWRGTHSMGSPGQCQPRAVTGSQGLPEEARETQQRQAGSDPRQGPGHVMGAV